MTTLTRDERESLLEELGLAKSYADEMRGIAKLMRTFAPIHGDAKDRYQETANALDDLAVDFEYAAPFAAMRRALEADEQADADREAAERRAEYHGSVL